MKQPYVYFYVAERAVEDFGLLEECGPERRVFFGDSCPADGHSVGFHLFAFMFKESGSF